MQPLRQNVRIGSTMLAGTQKKNILTPDAQGYYPVPVGAYNAFNSGGYLYDPRSGLAMFTPNSVLMRLVKKGCLYGEYMHPERTPDMSVQQYIARSRRVNPDRWSHHIRDYELVPSTDEHGRAITLVIAWLKPFGPYGKYVEESLKNPAQNTYFSVRCITVDDDLERIKYTREVITHDFVGEGGILGACKMNAPSLEEFSDSGIIVRPEHLHGIAREQDQLRRAGVSLEDHTQDVNGLIENLGWQRAKTTHERRPSYMKW